MLTRTEVVLIHRIMIPISDTVDHHRRLVQWAARAMDILVSCCHVACSLSFSQLVEVKPFFLVLLPI